MTIVGQRYNLDIGAFRKFILLRSMNITSCLLRYGERFRCCLCVLVSGMTLVSIERFDIYCRLLDNIERLVIDGVVDSENYFVGMSTSSSCILLLLYSSGSVVQLFA